MKKHATPAPRQPREIGLTAVLKTVRISPKISGDFASSVMGKYLGTENYRNFFARMVFHMHPEEKKEKGRTETVHHTHVYNRYVRVYQTVHSAPVFLNRYLQGEKGADRVHPVLQVVDGHAEIKNMRRELSAVHRELEREKSQTEVLRKEIDREKAQADALQKGLVLEHSKAEKQQKELERERLQAQVLQEEILREQSKAEKQQKELERERLQAQVLQEEILREQAKAEDLQKEALSQMAELQELRSQAKESENAGDAREIEGTANAGQARGGDGSANAEDARTGADRGSLISEAQRRSGADRADGSANAGDARTGADRGSLISEAQRQSGADRADGLGQRGVTGGTGRQDVADTSEWTLPDRSREATLRTADGGSLGAEATAGEADRGLLRAEATVGEADRGSLRTDGSAGEAGRGSLRTDGSAGETDRGSLRTEGSEGEAGGRSIEARPMTGDEPEEPGTAEAGVIEQLASTQPFASQADGRTGIFDTGDAGEQGVPYYDSDTHLTYYILPDGTRVEKEDGREQGSQSAAKSGREAALAGQVSVSGGAADQTAAGQGSSAQGSVTQQLAGKASAGDSSATRTGSGTERSSDARRSEGGQDAQSRNAGGADLRRQTETLGGTPAGAQAGTSAGANAGTQTGTAAGEQEGTSAGANAGTQTGTATGEQEGTSAGAQTGSDAGTAAGEQTGTSAGGQAGARAGVQAGTADSRIPPANADAAQTLSDASSEEQGYDDAGVIEQLVSTQPFMRHADGRAGVLDAGDTGERGMPYYDSDTRLTYYILPDGTRVEKEGGHARDAVSATERTSAAQAANGQRSTTQSSAAQDSSVPPLQTQRSANQSVAEQADARQAFDGQRSADTQAQGDRRGSAEASSAAAGTIDTTAAPSSDTQEQGDRRGSAEASSAAAGTIDTTAAPSSDRSQSADLLPSESRAQTVSVSVPDTQEQREDSGKAKSRPLRTLARMGAPEELNHIPYTEAMAAQERDQHLQDGLTDAQMLMALNEGLGTEGGSSADTSETDVIQRLTSAQNMSRFTDIISQTNDGGITRDSQEIVQYYDSNLNLVYYVLPDGTRVEADAGKASKQDSYPTPAPSAQDVITYQTPTPSLQDTAVYQTSVSKPQGTQPYETAVADAASSPSAGRLTDGSTYEAHTAGMSDTDTDVIGRLASGQDLHYRTAPGQAKAYDADEPLAAERHYDSGANLQYRILPDGTQVPAERGKQPANRVAALQNPPSSENGSKEERTVIRSIMRYLRGASETRTVYRNILTYLRSGNVRDALSKLADVSTMEEAYGAMLPPNERERILRKESVAVPPGAGEKILRQEPTELSARSARRQDMTQLPQESAASLLREERQTYIPRLRLLQKHFYIRQTRNIRRVFDSARPDGRTEILRTGRSDTAGRRGQIRLANRNAAAEWTDTPDLAYEIELDDMTEWIDTPDLAYAEQAGENGERQADLVNRSAVDEDSQVQRSQAQSSTVHRSQRGPAQMVQRRREVAAAGNKEEFTRIKKRLEALEEQQEIGESEFESAARIVRELQDELVEQKKNMEQLVKENQRLAADLKTQREQTSSDHRLEELFDNSGHLDRQRYGMMQLF